MRDGITWEEEERDFAHQAEMPVIRDHFTRLEYEVAWCKAYAEWLDNGRPTRGFVGSQWEPKMEDYE